jgi:hypothetical protein
MLSATGSTADHGISSENVEDCPAMELFTAIDSVGSAAGTSTPASPSTSSSPRVSSGPSSSPQAVESSRTIAFSRPAASFQSSSLR